MTEDKRKGLADCLKMARGDAKTLLDRLKSFEDDVALARQAADRMGGFGDDHGGRMWAENLGKSAIKAFMEVEEAGLRERGDNGTFQEAMCVGADRALVGYNEAKNRLARAADEIKRALEDLEAAGAEAERAGAGAQGLLDYIGEK